MRLKLLGTGNAAGMPLYGCNCKFCNMALKDHRLQRTPCSALIEVDNQRYLIDAGQVNLAQQFPAGELNGIFITHFHVDHIQGLFHLRWGKNISIPVYTPPDNDGCADLYKHHGILEFKPLEEYKSFVVGQLGVTPVRLNHSKMTFGYLLESQNKKIAYLTDTKGLPGDTIDFLKEKTINLMVIDCSFQPGTKNQGHNNLDDVIDIYKLLQPQKLILTHIGHDMDIWLKNNANALPDSFKIGHDEMDIILNETY